MKGHVTRISDGTIDLTMMNSQNINKRLQRKIVKIKKSN